MRLQRKIFLILLPCIVIPMLVLGVTAYGILSQTAEQKTFDQIDTKLDTIEEAFNTYVDNAKANVELFASSDLVTRYLLVEDEADRYTLLQPSLLTLLTSYQCAFPRYEEMRVLLPDGYEDTRSTLRAGVNATENEGDSGYFKRMAASTDNVHIEVIENADTGAMSLLIGKPILVSDPGIDPSLAKPILRGYFVVTSSLDFLREYHDAHFGPGGRVFFVDQNGRQLFVETPDAEMAALPANLLAALRDSAETGSSRLVQLGMEEMVVHGRPLTQNLMVYTTLPARELHSTSRALAAIVAISTIAAILFMAVLLFVMLKSMIIRPIQKLGGATHEISRGNLNVSVAISRDDEIGDLATAFGHMSASLRNSAQQIEHMAYFDTLTGLPNRNNFSEMVDRAIAENAVAKNPMAVLFIDLDDFKNVNDNLGHDAGDMLLRDVAMRLSGCVRRNGNQIQTGRPDDMIARLGGDEFVMLLTRVANATDAAAVARRLVKAVSAPFEFNGYSFHLGVSIGIATFPSDGETAEVLMRNADVAMYHCKKAGKNSFQFFSEAMNEAALERFTLENALRRAIESDQLVLHFQPMVDAETGRITTVETLLRWRHPSRGLLKPDAFIPIAEESGIIVRLGEWVLRQACHQVIAWDRAGHEPIRVAVNISNTQLTSNNFSEMVAGILKETGLAPDRLELEVTESSVMHTEGNGLANLCKVKKLGVRVAMDDFGTGYSSLAALRKLPVDILKIDRSFVEGVVTDEADATIVSVIVAMARLLDLEVVAEGVETEEQLAFLRKEGCHTIQGYFISRPLSVLDIEAVLPRHANLIARRERSGAA